ncbi:hypothetical protein [Microbacterium sp. CPCC 204701]|uniref:hypothetical protein n=1 Tax=Microbacterium sp. CPCC 204701 TaxID=2493084 RepID=UPI000FDB7BD8|nr:hypothetical protein [Microbacterium sp. CPCC 204701]
MDGSILILADRISRERSAALWREHDVWRTLVDRGIVVTPRRPTVDTPSGVGVWLRALFARSHRPRFT